MSKTRQLQEVESLHKGLDELFYVSDVKNGKSVHVQLFVFLCFFFL